MVVISIFGSNKYYKNDARIIDNVTDILAQSNINSVNQRAYFTPLNFEWKTN